MSFGTITTTTKTFNERSKGTYVASDVSFGNPENELRLRPNTNKKSPSLAVSRYKQVDYDNGTQVVRISATATLNIQLPAVGFNPSDIDVMVSEISEFVSSGNLSRMLQGES